MPPKGRLKGLKKRGGAKTASKAGGSDFDWASVSDASKPGLHLSFPSLAVNSVVACAVIVVFAILPNLSSLNNGFALDDQSAILNNPVVKGFAPLWTNDFWGQPMHHDGDQGSHKSYRPLTSWTYRAQYAAIGLDPRPYHLVNVALHVLVSVFTFMTTLFVTSGDTVQAFVAGILFASHPIHVEAVANLAGRAELLCALFYLLAVIFYLQSSMCKTVVHGSVFLLASTASFVASSLCKETGMTAIGIMLLYEIGLAWGNPKERKRAVYAVVRVGTTSAAVYALLAWRKSISGADLTPTIPYTDNPAAFQDSFLVRLLSFLNQHCIHAQLLVWPLGLRADYYPPYPTIVDSLADARNLRTILVYGGLLAAGLHALQAYHRGARGGSDHGGDGDGSNNDNKTHNNNNQAFVRLFALALALVPFLPATNLLGTVGFVVAERVLYVPSIGFCVLVAHSLSTATRRMIKSGPGAAAAVAVLALLVSAMFGLLTHQQNPAWMDSSTLAAANYKVCSVDDSCGHLTLSTYIDYHLLKGKGIVSDQGYRIDYDEGKADIKLEDLELAADLSYKTIRSTVIPTEHFEKFYRVIAFMVSKGHGEPARKHCERMAKMLYEKWDRLPRKAHSAGWWDWWKGHHPEEHNILQRVGDSYMKDGQKDEAISAFHRALKIAPYDPAPFLKHARAATEAHGKTEESRKSAKECLRLNAESRDTAENRRRVELNCKKYT